MALNGSSNPPSLPDGLTSVLELEHALLRVCQVYPDVTRTDCPVSSLLLRREGNTIDRMIVNRTTGNRSRFHQYNIGLLRHAPVNTEATFPLASRQKEAVKLIQQL